MYDTFDVGPPTELSFGVDELLASAGLSDLDGTPGPTRTETDWQLDRVGVREVMTADVVAVKADCPFAEVLAVVTEESLGAVPVVDTGRRVVGIISESDLLAKIAAAGRKAGAEDAASLMSAPAVTVADTESVVTAARLLTGRGLRRLPVVDDSGRLVGIVTRSDLLRTFRRDDVDIRRHVLKTVLRQQFLLPPGTVAVDVRDGVVSLTGELERAAVIPTLVSAVSGISGVVAVRDHLTIPHTP